jgi:hypothetical protein
MKTHSHKIVFLLEVIFLTLVPFALLSQTNLVPIPPVAPAVAPVPGIATLSNLFLLLIPIVTPLLIALGKYVVPLAPRWILPIVAPALGALLDYLGTLATGQAANPLLGLLLGSAGVGFREVVDQITTRAKEGPSAPVGVGKVAIFLLLLGLTGCLTGCSTTKPDGTKVPDPAKTQQVKDALEPIVRIPVRRIIMNSPQHSAEIALYFRSIGGIFCKMAADKQFDPTTLTAALQGLIPPNSLANEDVQALLDFKVALEKLYKLYWNDKLRAELPPDGWLVAVCDYFCVAIDNGLKDAGQPGTK